VVGTGVQGAERIVAPNLLFGENTTFAAPGLSTVFSGNLLTLDKATQLVLASGMTGGFSFSAPVGEGTGAFANLLVQGREVLIGPSAFLRAGNVSVDADVFINQAGSGGLSATTGRILLFSQNPNQNSPTSFNAGLSGVNPIFNQRAQVPLGLESGTYSIGNNLPGGSLAVYQASLADVIPDADLSQFADQQAYFAAVPVSAFQLPVPNLEKMSIQASEAPLAARIRLREPLSNDLGLGRKPNAPARPKAKVGRITPPSPPDHQAVIPTLPYGESYSQY